MSFLRRLLARAGDARLGVANCAVREINQAGADERRQRQDYRCRIAPGIRHQSSLPELVAMQFGNAINSLSRQLVSDLRISIMKFIDGAITRRSQPPSAAQVNHV